MDTLRKSYNNHRNNARHRGIDFQLSYEEWCSIWQDSGYAELRGTGRGRYCMSRYNDTGAYAVGNVFIQPSTANVAQRTTHTWSKPVELDGIVYPSIAAAARSVGRGSNTIKRWIISGKKNARFHK